MKPNPLKTLLALLVVLGGVGAVFFLMGRSFTRTDEQQATAARALISRPEDTFRTRQLEHSKVREALDTRGKGLEASWAAAGLSWPPRRIFMRYLKAEGLLEVWAGEGEGEAFPTRVLQLERCTGPVPANLKGKPQPIPEGFYSLSQFFPQDMNYGLSLGVSAPNAVDKAVLKGRTEPLFMRGACEDSGQVTVAEDRFQDLYLLAMEARSSGQKELPIHVYPQAMTAEARDSLQRGVRDARRKVLLTQLAEAWDRFDRDHTVLTPVMTPEGTYRWPETQP